MTIQSFHVGPNTQIYSPSHQTYASQPALRLALCWTIIDRTHQGAAGSYGSCRGICRGWPAVECIDDGVQDRSKGIPDPDIHRILTDSCLSRTCRSSRRSHVGKVIKAAMLTAAVLAQGARHQDNRTGVSYQAITMRHGEVGAEYHHFCPLVAPVTSHAKLQNNVRAARAHPRMHCCQPRVAEGQASVLVRQRLQGSLPARNDGASSEIPAMLATVGSKASIDAAGRYLTCTCWRVLVLPGMLLHASESPARKESDLLLTHRRQHLSPQRVRPAAALLPAMSGRPNRSAFCSSSSPHPNLLPGAEVEATTDRPIVVFKRLHTFVCASNISCYGCHDRLRSDQEQDCANGRQGLLPAHTPCRCVCLHHR